MELPTLIAITCAAAFLAPLKWFKASSFESDSYGFLTNQIGHTLFVGALGVFLLAVPFWVIVGEYPFRWQLFLAIVVGYVVFEFRQGFRGWDTIEDTAFVSYGAGGSLYASLETTAPHFDVDALKLVPFVTVFLIHLGVGSYVRVRHA